MLAAVPSPSFSSLVIQSPHAINFSKPAVLPIQVPLSADPEGFLSTDSASSQVSESRNSALSMVHSSVVNHRRVLTCLWGPCFSLDQQQCISQS